MNKKTVIRVIVECAVIYMIFVWNDGAMLQAIKNVLNQMWNVLKQIWNIFYPYIERFVLPLKQISPYGRSQIANDAYCKKIMDRCSWATGISFAAYLYMAFSKNSEKKFQKIFWALACSFVTWYILFADCFMLLVRIPQEQTTFSWLSIALASLILWLVIYVAFFKKKI